MKQQNRYVCSSLLWLDVITGTAVVLLATSVRAAPAIPSVAKISVDHGTIVADTLPQKRGDAEAVSAPSPLLPPSVSRSERSRPESTPLPPLFSSPSPAFLSPAVGAQQPLLGSKFSRQPLMLCWIRLRSRCLCSLRSLARLNCG